MFRASVVWMAPVSTLEVSTESKVVSKVAVSMVLPVELVVLPLALEALVPLVDSVKLVLVTLMASEALLVVLAALELLLPVQELSVVLPVSIMPSVALVLLLLVVKALASKVSLASVEQVWTSKE